MQSGDGLPTSGRLKALRPSVCRLSPTERTTLSESKCCFSSYEVGRLSADSRPTIAQRQTDLTLKQSADRKTDNWLVIIFLSRSTKGSTVTTIMPKCSSDNWPSVVGDNVTAVLELCG